MEQAIRIVGTTHHEAVQLVPVKVRPFSGRLFPALAVLLVSWLLVVPSVLVPVAHFFLVPGFIVLGPVVAYRIFTNRGRLGPATIRCAECEKTFELGPHRLEFPIYLPCPHCAQHLSILETVMPTGETPA